MVRQMLQYTCASVILLFFFCSLQNTPISDTGTKVIRPSVIWKTADLKSEPVNIAKVRFKIYSSSGEFKDTIKATFPYSSHEGTIRIPEDYGFTMTVEGLNEHGSAVFFGSIEITDTRTDPLLVTIEASQRTPLAPSDLKITAFSLCTYKLDWVDNADNENGFIIDVKNKSGNFDSLVTVQSDTCFFLHSDASPEKKYQVYRVRAFNDAGYSTPEIDSVKVLADNTTNAPPRFLIDSASVSGTAYLGSTMIFPLLAFDPNCESISFTACSTVTITTPSSVYWSPTPENLGINKFFVYVTDFSGLSDTLTWTWNVEDTLGPEIKFIGSDTIHLSLNDNFFDPGVRAIDLVDGDLSSSVKVSGEVLTTKGATYPITYSVSDQFGNKSTKTRLVIVYSGEVPDQTPPVLRLIGDDTITIHLGDNYSDSGAIAIDNHDDTITSKIVVKSSVDNSKPGMYMVQYSVSDSAKNSAPELIRYVRVIDTSVPKLTLTGLDTILVEIYDSFKDPGATAADSFDGDLSEMIFVDGSVDTSTSGNYLLRYTVTDAQGNADTAFRTVVVADRTPPQITLNGSDSMIVYMGGTYTEPGATALDRYDGDLTKKIEITGVIITTKPGVYSRIYNVMDSSGNNAKEVVRKISVLDTISPVITLLNGDTISIAVKTPFIDPGATALDNYYGNLTSGITVTGKVDTSKVATYTLTYSVKDSSGNKGVKERIVTVFDSTAPVVTLIGNQIIKIPVFKSYREPGAKATDNYDGILTDSIKITGTVDTAKVGNDTITYTVTDRSGNKGENYRIVTKYDSVAPLIKLIGKDTVRINVNDTFVDPGYTATDNYDGNLTDSVKVTGKVLTETKNTTTLEYNVKDSSGNAALKKVRIVIVEVPK